MTLAWAGQNGYIQQPSGWLDGIRLPRETHGRKVTRTELKPEETLAFVSRMKEPYSTLVLLLASIGMRGESAIGLKPTDLDGENVLHIRRVIYDGHEETLNDDEQEEFPLDAVVYADLLRRLRTQGAGAEWILHSRAGTPLNLGNARRRYLHPTAAAIGVTIGGWHDFRHTLNRMARRNNVHPVVISGVLGHKKVELAPEVYDRASSADIRDALILVGKKLLPIMLPIDSVN
jgi:integrase